MHRKEIQSVLDHIETHLCEALTLDQLAHIAGFSKFYFCRLFQREVGVPLYDYIRRRRLTDAASALLHTDIGILKLALAYHFESQESFTRAFKSIYKLPPGRYRSAIKGLIQGGSISMNTQAKFKNWIITGTAPEKFAANIDTALCHTGSRSATLYSLDTDLSTGDYATIMQQINAKPYTGKRMRFSGFVKTSNVKGWCGLWLRIDNALGVTLTLDNMQNRAISGTTAWNHYACVLDIPAEGATINCGVLLCGQGQVWFDDAGFQEVERSIPTTEFVPQTVFPDQLLNASFEDQ
ncbi:MAG: AraC family transcriptional regulator [Sporolactobacillus sp.]